MLGRFVAAAAVIVGTCLAANAQAQDAEWRIDFGRYHALVIGNVEYRHLPRLQTAVKDAEAVAKLLEAKYGFSVKTLLNATRQDILDALNRFRRDLTEQDNLLIYYAGHGELDAETDTGFWLPVDAEQDSDTFWVSNEELARRLRAISALHVLVVADSCYAGTILRDAPTRLRSGAGRAAWFNEMNRLRSRTALVSGSIEPVADTGGGGHSVFARAFLDALRTNTEVLRGQSLFDKISRPVHLNTRQTPRYSDIRLSDHQGGEFMFVPATLEAAVSLEPGLDIDPIEAEYVAVKRARVRQRPTVQSARIAMLEPGARVHVAGKVKGTRWLLVESDDGPLGYVFGDLLNRLETPPRPPERAVAVAPPPQAPRPPGAKRPVVGIHPIRPGDGFRDCDACPEMVAIPAGGFVMGSPAAEIGRRDSEGPTHRVAISRAFALGKYEVTFDEWDACVQAGGCGRRPDDEGWGRGRRPVINVDWDDARTYVNWLSRRTGQAYRLASESEWAYAARAGSGTARFWGDEADRACAFANVHDRTSKSVNGYEWPHHRCQDGHAATAPVGSFAANGFGLYDVLGNVWEWTADCWNRDYRGAPQDGAAWRSGDCDFRVLRGGPWSLPPWDVRSAVRLKAGPRARNTVIGFRVARTLPPRGG